LNISINDYAKNHTELIKNSDRIDPELYGEYGVKSGLRNKDGSGILAGLTNISKIIAKKISTAKWNLAAANFGTATMKSTSL
jgi:citrate synthase